MTNSCQIFTTEYQRHFTKKKQLPAEKVVYKDRFAERIEEGQIDPLLASIPTELDEAAEKLVHNRTLDNERSVYQVTYKDPWLTHEDYEEEVGRQKFLTKEGEDTKNGFESELLTYIRKLYFDPHEENILAPLPTSKRVLGYIRPKLLHGSLSMYQDTYGRTGGMIMLADSEVPAAHKKTETKIIRHKLCDAEIDPS